jgi:hypothetical protein
MLSPLIGRRADWRACVKVAAYGATPLWLASALLVVPFQREKSARYVAMAMVISTVAMTLAGGAVASFGLL